MRAVAWASPALQDLEEIFDFYLFKNPSVAAEIHDSIIDEANRLSEWPNIGQCEHFVNNQKYDYPCRSLVTKDGLYRIVYFVTTEKIVIARVWSCRKNPKDFSLFKSNTTGE